MVVTLRTARIVSEVRSQNDDKGRTAATMFCGLIASGVKDVALLVGDGAMLKVMLLCPGKPPHACKVASRPGIR